MNENLLTYNYIVHLKYTLRVFLIVI